MPTLFALALEKALKNMSANEIKNFVKTNRLPNRYGGSQIAVNHHLTSNRNNVFTPKSRAYIKKALFGNIARHAASVANWKRYENQYKNNLTEVVRNFMYSLGGVLTRTPSQLSPGTKKNITESGKKLLTAGILNNTEKQKIRNFLNFVKNSNNSTRRLGSPIPLMYKIGNTRVYMGNTGRERSVHRAVARNRRNHGNNTNFAYYLAAVPR